MIKNRLEISKGASLDLVCFSHLRWDFVYQRPQHLMKRLGKQFRIFFIEEPVSHQGADGYRIRPAEKNVWAVTPLLKDDNADRLSRAARQRQIVSSLFIDKKIQKHIAWYYTPMALKIAGHLKPEVIVYDCMDELSAFKFAPAELKILEAELFSRAHLVFTGGHSLYQAKRKSHPNIYPFPSSIDKAHFGKARKNFEEPADQQPIPHRRFGFFGVIDERFDIKLIKEIAEKRPDWHLVLIGPVVKIDPDNLPKAPNIHYLGCKSYDDLPCYLAGWDFAIIPFEKNESTKFISPTKTPEYLAAGKPVISTSITDVVSPYGDRNLVYIADDADRFIAAAEREFRKPVRRIQKWLADVDAFLENVSRDDTVRQMTEKINDCIHENELSAQDNRELWHKSA